MRPKQAARRPVIKRMATTGPASSMILDHSTSVTQNSGRVVLTVSIGAPIISPAAVKNAPGSVKFSNVNWPSLANAPNGFTIERATTQGGATYPVLAITFAIPENAKSFVPVFDQLATSPLGNIHLAPTSRQSDGKQTDQVFDPRTLNASWSLTPTIGKARTFRSLRTITVRYPLISSSGGALTALSKFRVGINFTASGASVSAPVNDALFAGLNTHFVANGWDLPQFRVPLRPAQARPFAIAATNRVPRGGIRPLAMLDSTAFAWIDPSAEYVKLSVTRDGLYRVTANDIIARTGSFDPAQFTQKNLRCINRGVEIPIWIDTDASGNITAIEFYGEHLHGVPLNDGLPEFYNITTDTNAYWLTNSSQGGTHRRYMARAPNPTLASSSVSTGTIELHHERDYFYYFGDSRGRDEITVHPSTYTPGERFEWYEIHSPLFDTAHVRLIDTFIVSKLPANTQGKAATLQILARGMTQSVNGQHRVIAKINGSPVYDGSISDFNEDTSRVVFPLSQLHEGANTLEMTTAAGADTIDFYYFDHYSVRFEGGLAPNRDTAFAPGQWRFGLQPASPAFQISLTSSDTPHLYNMSDGTRILPQAGAFIDSPMVAQPSYTAATMSSLLACDRIEKWNSDKVGSWNILKTTNHADYIIITHPEFLIDAQLLALRRTAAGLASMIVTTDEVYNAFDYGSGEPDAIRRFLSYAYFMYQDQQGLPVGYVTLFGAGTWDPKFNLNNVLQARDSRTVLRSFIPTYGWPTSDFYYTLAEDGRLDTIQPRMVISRIPVSSAAGADAYVKKLQEYEDGAPAQWNRQFLFLAGGSGTSQHQDFMDQIHGYMDPSSIGLSAPPTNVRYHIIERDSALVKDPGNTTPDPSHVAEIQSDIENGISLMYFAGHGATFTSDILLPDAVTLHNQGLYPLLFTVSCRTGAFGEPNQPTVNSSYLQQPGAGCVVAYGTSGFGEIGYDGTLSAKFFDLMRHWREDVNYPRIQHDTTRPMLMNLTAMLTAAKLFASDSGGYGDVGLNLRLQYTALGDAAVGFALRPQAELSIQSPDISASTQDGISKTAFSVSDSVLTISALVHNYGYAAETPLVIRIEDIPPSGTPLDVFDTLSRLDDTARVSAQFHLTDASIGEHTIAVSIDPGRHFRPFETDTTDDDASLKILVNGLSATPFYPWEGARNVCDVSGSNVHFIVLLPPHIASRIQFELDTTPTFAHPLLSRDTAAGSRFYGSLDVSLSGLLVPAFSVYWWRTRIIRLAGDTSVWEYATFSTASAARAEFSYTSADQLASTIVSGLAADPVHGLYLPKQDTVRYDVISHAVQDSGSVGFSTSLILINDHPVVSYSNQGYLIARLTNDRGGIDTVYEFDVDYLRNGDSAYTLPIANAFDSVLKSFPDSTAVIVLTNVQPAFSYFTYNNQNVTRAMQSIGSLVGFANVQYFNGYALFGVKGWLPGMAREVISPQGGHGAHLSDTVVTFGTSGLALTPFTAIARNYGKLRVNGQVPSGSDVLVTVLGSRRDGSGIERIDTLRASQGSQLDLSKTDPRIYDRLGLRMDFQRTTNAAQSPELHTVELEYDAAPEFAFTTDSIATTPNSIAQGGTLTAPYSIQTLTCDSALNVLVTLVGNRISTTDTIAHAIPLLRGHSSASFSDSINTTNQLGTVPLIATVNPHEVQNEQLLFNDAITGAFTVTPDTLLPRAEILLDDNHVSPCGYVSSNDTTTINLYSQNFIRDTSSNSILATFQRDTEYYPEVGVASPKAFNVRFVTQSTGPLQAQLIISPGSGFHFKPGQWNVTATVKDASGNVDTVHQCFTISATNGLDHVMNYPNPFKDKTLFTFVLFSDAAADVKVIVYTVAGRKIRTLIPSHLRAGLNMIEWDGRDEKGNDVGNGTYLYRVTLNGKNPDGTDVSAGVTEKAVRSR